MADKIDLVDRGVFLFIGEVDDDLCKDSVEWLLQENFEGRHQLLTMIVNSEGGSCTAGFSVVDMMVGSKIPVRTVGIGALQSMGLHIFISGLKGERTLTPNTLIMSHQWTWGTYGKEHELISSTKAYSILSDITIKHYRKHTGLTEKNIRKYLMPASDVWLSAEEALSLGLCDKIADFDVK